MLVSDVDVERPVDRRHQARQGHCLRGLWEVRVLCRCGFRELERVSLKYKALAARSAARVLRMTPLSTAIGPMHRDVEVLAVVLAERRSKRGVRSAGQRAPEVEVVRVSLDLPQVDP